MIIRSSFDLQYLLKVEPTSEYQATLSLGEAVVLEDDLPDTIYVNGDGFKIVFTGTRFYLEVYEKFSFSISDKTLILLELKNDATIKEALPYFYGTVLTVLLHMSLRFPIHASSVLSADGLNLFCAASGTGKSTLAFRLFESGYTLFSDDKSVFQWDRILQKYIAAPSIRALRLCQDAIDNLSQGELLGSGIPVIAKNDKFQFNLNEIMSTKPAFINKIFIIRKVKNGDQILIKQIVRKEVKLKALKQQLHRPGLITGEEMTTRVDLFLRKFGKSIPLYLVKRPASTSIEEFVEFMKNEIGEKPV